MCVWFFFITEKYRSHAKSLKSASRKLLSELPTLVLWRLFSRSFFRVILPPVVPFCIAPPPDSTTVECFCSTLPPPLGTYTLFSSQCTHFKLVLMTNNMFIFNFMQKVIFLRFSPLPSRRSPNSLMARNIKYAKCNYVSQMENWIFRIFLTKKIETIVESINNVYMYLYIRPINCIYRSLVNWNVRNDFGI